MLTKTFAKVSNEKCLVLVTSFLGNEWWNIGKKTFASHYWNTDDKDEKKIELQRQLQGFLRYTQMQKIFLW